MCGHPDDIVNTHSNAKGLLQSYPVDSILRRFVLNKVNEPGIYDLTDYNYYVSHLTFIPETNYRYVQGLSDMANDIFQISGQGLSGTFIYNDDKNLVFSGPLGAGHQGHISPKIQFRKEEVTKAAKSTMAMRQRIFRTATNLLLRYILRKFPTKPKSR